MNKTPTKSGIEVDWVSKARRRGVITFNAGVGKAVKKALHKRARKLDRDVIAEQDGEAL